MTFERASFWIAAVALATMLALTGQTSAHPSGHDGRYVAPPAHDLMFVFRRGPGGQSHVKSFVSRRVRSEHRQVRSSPTRNFLASRFGKHTHGTSAQRYPRRPWLSRTPGQSQAGNYPGKGSGTKPLPSHSRWASIAATNRPSYPTHRRWASSAATNRPAYPTHRRWASIATTNRPSYPTHGRWASIAANRPAQGPYGHPPIPAGTGQPPESGPYPKNPGHYWVWGPFPRPRPSLSVSGGDSEPSTTSAPALAGSPGGSPPVITNVPPPQLPLSAAALLDNKRHRPNELLIEVPNDSANQLKQVLANQYGVEVRELGVVELLNVRFWHLTLVRGQDLRGVLEQLLRDNRVISVQPNYVYVPVQGARQGDLAPSFSPAALTRETSAEPSGAGVKVAIIDTCLDNNHTELQGAVTALFDAMPSSQPGICQAEDHGTAVASLIGGRGQVQGAATGASLISARAFALGENNETTGSSREIMLALGWAAKSGARIANLSFAGPSDPIVKRAVAAAYANGIVLIGAAGNGGPKSEPLYPAAYPEVIAVTATDGRRQLYSAANRGPYVSVSARGVDVIVAHAGNSYGTESGTSFAAATVSGVVAVMLEKRPKASPSDIRAALENTALNLAGQGRNEAFGYGFVNPKAATTFVEAKVPE